MAPDLSRRRHQDFYTWTAARPVVEVGGLRIRPPLVYHRAELFKSLHLATYDAAREILPSDELHPLRWVDGRAMIGVAAFRYEHVSVEDADGTTRMLTPYGEIGINLLATRHPTRVRGLGMLQAMLGSARGFVVDLPVTTAEACAAGRQIWGFPQFVADMDFTEAPGRRVVDLWEGNAHILTMEVRTGGPVVVDRAPLTSYSVLHGQLIETSIRFQGHRQAGLGAGAGEISLGQHPVAHRLRTLGLVPTPLAAAIYLDARLALPVGLPVGSAREYVGHLGEGREHGRLTVSHPGTGPIDLYAVPAGVASREPGDPAVTPDGPVGASAGPRRAPAGRQRAGTGTPPGRR